MTGEQHPEMWKPHGAWRPCYRDRSRRPDGETPCEPCRKANREQRARERENAKAREPKIDTAQLRAQAADIAARRRARDEQIAGRDDV